MELSEDVIRQLRQFSSKVDALQATARATCSKANETKTENGIERAKIYLSMARQIHEAMVLLSSASGKERPTMHQDKERIETFSKKLNKAESTEILKRGKPEHIGSINIAAANRFISQAIPELSIEQKNKLKAASNAVKAAAAEGQGSKGSNVGKRKKETCTAARPSSAQEGEENMKKKAAIDFLNSL